MLLFDFRKLFISSVLCFLASLLAQADILAAYSVPDHLHLYPGICFKKCDLFFLKKKKPKFQLCLGLFFSLYSLWDVHSMFQMLGFTPFWLQEL